MMILNNVFEQAIKAHVKEREELLQYKGIKVLTSKLIETVECHDGTQMMKFKVVTAVNAKRYENNRVEWQVNLYDDPEGKMTNTIGVYFDGSHYVA